MFKFRNGVEVNSLRKAGEDYYVTMDGDDCYISICFRRGTGIKMIRKKARGIFKIFEWEVELGDDLGTREVSGLVFLYGKKGNKKVWDIRFSFLSGLRP